MCRLTWAELDEHKATLTHLIGSIEHFLQRRAHSLQSIEEQRQREAFARLYYLHTRTIGTLGSSEVQSLSTVR
jgi:hypothetical protein